MHLIQSNSTQDGSNPEYQDPFKATIILFFNDKLITLIDSDAFFAVEVSANDDDSSDLDWYMSLNHEDTEVPLWYEDPEFQKLLAIGKLVEKKEMWEWAQAIHYLILDRVMGDTQEVDLSPQELENEFKEIDNNFGPRNIQQAVSELLVYASKLSNKVSQILASHKKQVKK